MARRASGPVTPADLVCDGRGDGLVDEMQAVLDDSAVQFGLVQIPLGSGTFRRTKMIFLQWQGESCPAMKRAKHVARSGEVSQVLGSTHASLTITQKKECCIEHVLEELKRVFVSDSGDFSIAGLKEEIQKQVEAAKEAAAAAATQSEAEPKSPASPGSPKRKTAIDLGVTAEQVLAELRKDVGKFNWCLFEPSEAGAPLKLFNAGSRSIEELAEHVPSDKVLFGLLRIGFGAGKFRRTRWVCITYVGESVGAVKRGKWLGCKADMQAKLQPFQVSLELQGRSEAQVESIFGRIKEFIVADDIEMGEISLAAFMESLQEEVNESAAFFGDEVTMAAQEAAAAGAGGASAAPAARPQYDVAETVKLVHAEGAVHWACFSLK
eukprot:TRINITY_DN22432_c0_g1_i1.p1 TRINITY_DN22432_c0_g1~~TRINITY_DN22432_c0_g1_i1.p1  ORF type:complete len:380 (+),score=156.31 TRINITY_DN22432_c0_g1_i1:85-1224(+)